MLTRGPVVPSHANIKIDNFSSRLVLIFSYDDRKQERKKCFCLFFPPAVLLHHPHHIYCWSGSWSRGLGLLFICKSPPLYPFPFIHCLITSPPFYDPSFSSSSLPSLCLLIRLVPLGHPVSPAQPIAPLCGFYLHVKFSIIGAAIIELRALCPPHYIRLLNDSGIAPSSARRR